MACWPTVGPAVVDLVAGATAVVAAMTAAADTAVGTFPAAGPAPVDGPPAIPGRADASRAGAVHVGGCVPGAATPHTPRPPGTRPRSGGSPGIGRDGHRRLGWAEPSPVPRRGPGRSARAGIPTRSGPGDRSGKPAGRGRIARTGRSAPRVRREPARRVRGGPGTWPAMLARRVPATCGVPARPLSFRLFGPAITSPGQSQREAKFRRATRGTNPTRHQ